MDAANGDGDGNATPPDVAVAACGGYGCWRRRTDGRGGVGTSGGWYASVVVSVGVASSKLDAHASMQALVLGNWGRVEMLG